jgi:hypothetical protein
MKQSLLRGEVGTRTARRKFLPPALRASSWGAARACFVNPVFSTRKLLMDLLKIAQIGAITLVAAASLTACQRRDETATTGATDTTSSTAGTSTSGTTGSTGGTTGTQGSTGGGTSGTTGGAAGTSSTTTSGTSGSSADMAASAASR